MKRAIAGAVVAGMALAWGGAARAASDLGLAISDSPDPVRVGNNLTYSLAVTNRGPDRATNVVVTSILPSSAGFVSCSVSVGSWSNDSGTVFANLGNLLNGATARVVIVASPSAPGVVTNDSSINAVNSPGGRASAVTTVKSPNRAPEISLPGPHTLPVGSVTSFVVVVEDPDHDPSVTFTNTIKPAGASYTASNFTWTAAVSAWNTTSIVEFVANDNQGETNSVVTNRTTIVVPRDGDADAMDDAWEWNNFQTLTNSPAGDRDGDGQDNATEYIAGTQPTNSTSLFAATDQRPAGGQYVIRWPRVASRYYDLYRGTNSAGSLQLLVSGLQVGSYTDAVSALDRAFYRVKVRTN